MTDFRALETDNTAFDFPTVIAFEDLTVNFFNEKFRGIVPDIAAGEPLAKYMTIRGLNELIRENTAAPCVAEIGGRYCMCAFCPIYSGFVVDYSFSAALPETDDSLRYLMMKLAVLNKCAGGFGVRRKASKPEPGNNDLLRRIEDCVRLTDAAYGENRSSSVNINSFMTDVFGYYTKLKYGDGKPHIRILTDDELVVLDNASCIELLSLFHFSMKTSFNGFAEISTESTDLLFKVTVVFRSSKRVLSRMFDENGETDDNRIYDALGFDGSDLIYAKKLALGSEGQVDIKFDGKNVIASLTVPKATLPPVRSPAYSPAFMDLSKNVVRILLGRS